jgi:hypothetical protein
MKTGERKIPAGVLRHAGPRGPLHRNQAAVTSVSRDLILHLRDESHRVQNWICRSVAIEFRQNSGWVKRLFKSIFPA